MDVATEGFVTGQVGGDEGEGAPDIAAGETAERVFRSESGAAPPCGECTLSETASRLRRSDRPDRQPQSAEVRQPFAKLSAVVQHLAEKVAVRRHIRRHGKIRDRIAVDGPRVIDDGIRKVIDGHVFGRICVLRCLQGRRRERFLPIL